jgi:hypothetical protein
MLFSDMPTYIKNDPEKQARREEKRSVRTCKNNTLDKDWTKKCKAHRRK